MAHNPADNFDQKPPAADPKKGIGGGKQAEPKKPEDLNKPEGEQKDPAQAVVPPVAPLAPIVPEPDALTPMEMQEDPKVLVNQDILKQMGAAEEPQLAEDYPKEPALDQEPKVQTKMRPIGERREEVERELAK